MSPRTQSPVVATIITGTIIGLLAFFVPLETLADLVSMGTLFAFSVVTMSVAVRARYVTDRDIPKWRLLVPAGVVVAGSCLIAFPFYYRAHWGIIVAGACVIIIGTLAFYTLPVVYRPEGFKVPLNPILPCLGTLANIFLIGEGIQSKAGSSKHAYIAKNVFIVLTPRACLQQFKWQCLSVKWLQT